MNDLDRRTVLLGSAGMLVLAGCSGSDGKTKQDDGPVIVDQETGNLVMAKDTEALVKRLGEAFRAHDVAALAALVDPDSYDDAFEKRWRRRSDNFERIGVVEGQWFVGAPSGRTRNSSGGLVEYDGDLVFGHRITDCDSRYVVESYGARFRKKSTDAPLEVLRVGEVQERFDPSIWDITEIDVITTKHAIIAFRGEDRARAKALAAEIDKGAARAKNIITPPKGVSKFFYVVGWGDISKTLYGGGGSVILDSDGAAYSQRYLDPDELASGQKRPAEGKDAPLTATGRILLQPSLFGSSSARVTEVACHEAAHLLCNQWGWASIMPNWVIEGIATWTGLQPGSGRLMRENGGVIRSQFAAFRQRMQADDSYDGFHKTPMRLVNYQCSGAVFEYLDQEEGRKRALQVAEGFYAEDRDLIGTTPDALLAATQKWLGA